MMRRAAAAVLLAAAACSAGGAARSTGVPATKPPAGGLKLTSPAFTDGGRIPQRYTCQGSNETVPLAWSGVPAGTVKLVLLVEDPDAPGGMFVHWAVDAIPPAGGSAAQGRVVQGWRGPCPPPGRAHRYVFTLAAVRDFSAAQTVAGVRAEIAGAASVARLTGLYGRR